MSDILEIQGCTVADANKISEVAIKSYKEYYLYLWDDDGSWYINRSFLPETLKEEIKNPNARFYSLNAGGEIIGFMKLNLKQPLTGTAYTNAMELERIYIAKAYAGKGFGREAVEFCLQLAKEMNKDIVWLKSMDSSKAITFYKRLGFEECGTFTLDYKLMKPIFRGMKIFMKKLH